MFKTIDFYEIEKNPEIIDEIFQQLIWQYVNFKIVSNPAASRFDMLSDFIIEDNGIMEILFRESSSVLIDFSLDGYLEIKIDVPVNKITVCYKKV